ncbi:hypothetical protein NA57DRAFT_61818 [Rhizodiscina lignyota]|uniref:Uncharacterized protein n=1 Tax=Rhizodiscina lignyota TaxID=1504668 RepID=A0A9P4I523_9PEZI|nr:hypothetical protein NA57DRAFT_61818 [Rhizodiscina lignyota]
MKLFLLAFAVIQPAFVVAGGAVAAAAPAAAVAADSSSNEHKNNNKHHLAQEYAITPSNATYTRLEQLGYKGETLCDFDISEWCSFRVIEPSRNASVIIASDWCVQYLSDVRKKLEKAGFARPQIVLEADRCDFFKVATIPHSGVIYVRPFAPYDDELRAPAEESIATMARAVKSTVPGAEIALLAIFLGPIVLIGFVFCYIVFHVVVYR